jgi:malonyl-ACP decarboxylase
VRSSLVDPVAVTGTGLLGASVRDVPEFTEALARGHSALTRPERTGTDPSGGPARQARIGALDLAAALDRIPGLSARQQALAVRTANRSPLPVRAATVAALQAWQQAGLEQRPIPPERIGIVVAGANLTERYTEDVGGPEATYLPARYALQHQDTDHVGTLSRVLGITGEGYCVGGASAGGNVAIVNAARLLRVGAVDACLVVGALTTLSRLQERGFLGLGAMAAAGPDPDEAPGVPFDVTHRGFHPGQAAAAVVLEHPLSAARRGAPELARLLGYALGLDGNHLADPSVDGEARVMASAIASAGLAPGDVGYVNAHGTGSPQGDRVESEALLRVFGSGPGRPWVNSTKGITGHCLSAAGVVEAVATVMQLRAGFVHPNVGLGRSVVPSLRLVGGQRVAENFRFALSNGFGFGGINTAVLLGPGQDRPGDAQL